MNIAILNPKGWVALQEFELIKTSVFLMLIIVIPVFLLTIFIARRYRASNKNAKYTPDWDGNFAMEIVRWGLPSLVIIALAVVTWNATHKLDPYKPLQSNVPPITIQVVALEWKWLFIYPEENIAAVNFIEFPAGTPVNFELTADAPMNSFWIPQLGGQMYAMSGMSTKLHLIADEPGEFAGSAAEINGRGFSGMKFTAKATSQEDFDKWVLSIKESPNTLSLAEYNNLAIPSENNPTAYYSSVEENLYDNIIMKFHQ